VVLNAEPFINAQSCRVVGFVLVFKPPFAVFLSKLFIFIDSVAALYKNFGVFFGSLPSLFERSNKLSTRAAASIGIVNVRARMGIGVVLRIIMRTLSTPIGVNARLQWIERPFFQIVIVVFEPFPTVFVCPNIMVIGFAFALIKNVSRFIRFAAAFDILNKASTSRAIWILIIITFIAGVV